MDRALQRAAAKELKLSIPTVSSAIDSLIEVGIVHEITGKRRNRLFAYPSYLTQLDKGTEPLAA